MGNKLKQLNRVKAKDSMRKKVEDSIDDMKKFWNQVKTLTLTGLGGSVVSVKSWLIIIINWSIGNLTALIKGFIGNETEFIEAYDATCILCQNNVNEGDPDLENKTNDLILNLTPENVTQYSRIE